MILQFLQLTTFAQSDRAIFDRLKKSYPDAVEKFSDNKIFFKDKSFLIFDDKKQKTASEILENPDIQDMFLMKYASYKNKIKTDAGRVRNDTFFKKIYGNSKSEVEKNLVQIVWCPKLVNQKIYVTTNNGVSKKLKKISAELDEIPSLKKYLVNIGGTFNWRKIASTNRQSMHSYGMTIDINSKYSNYWQWICKCHNEKKTVPYQNQIPEKIVEIFEKQGFIWGGNWEHFDTMHFEYRPELLLE